MSRKIKHALIEEFLELKRGAEEVFDDDNNETEDGRPHEVTMDHVRCVVSRFINDEAERSAVYDWIDAIMGIDILNCSEEVDEVMWTLDDLRELGEFESEALTKVLDSIGAPSGSWS